MTKDKINNNASKTSYFSLYKEPATQWLGYSSASIEHRTMLDYFSGQILA